MNRGQEILKTDNSIMQELDVLLEISEQHLKSGSKDKIRFKLEQLFDQFKTTPLLDVEEQLTDAIQIGRVSVEEVGLGVTSVLAVISYRLCSSDLLSLEDIKSVMPQNVVGIVKGLLKIADFGTNTTTSQAENFRKLLLSLVVDVRVILLKLSEVLYNMRNIKKQTREQQVRLAHEAFFLYIPLGHRLGLYKVKSEMEDIALKITSFDIYKDIANKLQQTAKARNNFIREFIEPIKVKLENQGYKYEIKGRPKTIYSIYQKMKNNNISFDEVYDKFAIRIILNSNNENEKADCWRVYSIVTDTYQPNPLRLRDWISVPKSNGYESLHTTVVVPGGQWVEVQIRTRRMDEIAEKGFAAHWKYKGGKSESGLEQWLTKVRDILEDPEPDAEKFIDEFKLSLYNKEIFVFTPKGDLKKFPKGASVLDFAFDIHTDIGSSCVGALINGRNVPIRHQMQNGDKVEILTSKNQKPKQDWLHVVVTSKAKSKIKHMLNETKLKDAEIGKDLIKRRFKNWKINYNDININHILRHFKLKNSQDFYALIANEKLDVSDVKDVLTDIEQKEEKHETPLSLNEPAYDSVNTDDDYLIIDEKLANVDYKLARCCNPVYGDEIFGFVTINDGIKIHRISCPNATQLLNRYNYRIVKAKWKQSDVAKLFTAEIFINGIDEFGLLNKISEVISNDMKMTLRSVNIDTSDGMFSGNLKVMVKNKSQLDGLLRRIVQIPGVLKATRVDDY
jgi:GTP pyrophosphokinase